MTNSIRSNATLYVLAILISVASALSIAALPAEAKVINCTKTVCKGTNHKDTITGNSLSQTITGARNNDLIVDTEKSDNDTLRGGRGSDTINAQEGHFGQNEADTVDGGPGYDRCFVDLSEKQVSDTVSNCEEVNGVVQQGQDLSKGSE